MTERRRVQRLRVLSLLLGLVALGFLLLRITGVLGITPLTGVTEPIPTGIPTTVPVTPHPSLPTETATHIPPSQTVDPLRPTTPADPWANRVLDLSLPSIEGINRTESEFVWWQSSTARGELRLEDGAVMLASTALELEQLRALEILVPDPVNPDRLNRQASIDWEGEALVLTAGGSSPSVPDTHWLLSNASPALAVTALVNQAEARELTLVAAFTGTFAQEAKLVLTGVIGQDATAILPTQADGPTPNITVTPSPALTPTPTREPDFYLGLVIAGKIDPVIDATDTFTPEAVARYTGNHPWTGLLTWTETGPEIGGRPVAVQQADELSLYTLQADDTSGSATRFLYAVYDGQATRLPEDSVFFQDKRMAEILFWVVRHAAERDGQLLVAYDDFGARQAITILGFRPLTDTSS